MLELIEGGFLSGTNSELTRKIVEVSGSARKVYLIVPEQQTVMAECEMCEILPPSAPLYFEVTNFTRFTNTAFREIGGISGEYCSPAAKSLIMWRVISELRPMLEMTKRSSSVTSGTVKKALSAVEEVRSIGIAAGTLTEIADGGNARGRLLQKLHDLSLIYSLYTERTQEKYTDAASDAMALSKMFEKDASFLSGCEIFIDGFTSFTEPQYMLLGEIMRHVPVHIVLTLDHTRRTAFEYTEVAKTRARLIRLADLAGVNKRLQKCSKYDMTRKTVIGEVADLLWQSEGELDADALKELAEDGGRVKIFEAPTMYEEAEIIASDIKRRVMAGAKYSDFAIITRDTKPYIGVLDDALDLAGVPYFLSKSADIGATSAVKFIRTAYAAVFGGYRRESVLTYLKCGLSQISRDDIDEFEMYVEKWDIDGAKFKESAPWRMNPRGYESICDGDEDRLLRINSVRDSLMSELSRLENAAKSATTVKTHAEALLSYLTEIDFPERLKSRAEKLLSLGEGEVAAETLRHWGLICDALDAVVDILGDAPAEAEEFLEQWGVALSGLSVGRIPMYTDTVIVGAADMVRVRGKKYVYLMGVNAGEFPASVHEGTFFTERDKAELFSLGLMIEPDLEVRGARELYSFSRAFTLGSECVTLTYSKKTPMLAPLNPAEPIARIKEITRGTVVPKKYGDIPPQDLIYSTGSALLALRKLDGGVRREVTRALRNFGLGERVDIAYSDIKNANMTLGDEALALLYHGDLYLSQSKIKEFLSCPMSYFCKYNLRLGESCAAEIDQLVIGTFVHGVLEDFFRTAESEGRSVGDLTPEERDGLTKRCAERYVEALLGQGRSNARTRVTISRLARATRPVVDGLCEEFAASGYKPKFFELDLDMYDGSLPSPLVINDESGKIIIGGKVDRVDTFENGGDTYVRVVDYKTGSTEFLPSKLKEGEYLQMFIYLRAITETNSPEFLSRLGAKDGGRVIPGGVIYVKTAINDAILRREEDRDAVLHDMNKRDGMVLEDEINTSAMNPDFMPPTPSERARKFEPRFYTEEGWREISDTLEEVITEVAHRMKSGEVKTTPGSRDGKSCDRCSYKSVCRSARPSGKSW